MSGLDPTFSPRVTPTIAPEPFGPRVNDFSLRIATVNGTGSQSANQVLVRTLFEMGITAVGKNLFPSNISGLPTWYTVRLSPDGAMGSHRRYQILVAMNRHTAAEDLAGLTPGGLAIVDEAALPDEIRDDVDPVVIPFARLARTIDASARLRKLLTNMIFVGVLGELLGLDQNKLTVALEVQFQGKDTAVALNLEAIALGRAWVADNLEPQDRFRVAAGDATVGKILVDGNEAAAYGALFGGVQLAAWYPITPSSSLAEHLAGALDRHRRDPVTGRARFAVLQAEDEIAALGMVLGAGWGGARALTATSGPGISLMSELAGLAAFAEVPAVVVDVQRLGPSTGLPTRTSQGDVAMLAGASHGDTRHPVLFPAGPNEYFTMMIEAFDLAERLQTLVFVAADLDLGMNQWVDDALAVPERPLDRGKILSADDLDRLADFARYRDVDGDGIPWRTRPGTVHPGAAYFLRGSGHDEQGRYSEDPEIYRRLLDRLAHKLDANRHRLPAPIVEPATGARVGLIAYGTSHWSTAEARQLLARDHDLATAYLRLRSWPPTEAVGEFIAGLDRVYVVEQNRDGQLTGLLRAELPGLAPRLEAITYYEGTPLPVEHVTEAVLELEARRPS